MRDYEDFPKAVFYDVGKWDENDQNKWIQQEMLKVTFCFDH